MSDGNQETVGSGMVRQRRRRVLLPTEARRGWSGRYCHADTDIGSGESYSGAAVNADLVVDPQVTDN